MNGQIGPPDYPTHTLSRHCLLSLIITVVGPVWHVGVVPAGGGQIQPTPSTNHHPRFLLPKNLIISTTIPSAIRIFMLNGEEADTHTRETE